MHSNSMTYLRDAIFYFSYKYLYFKTAPWNPFFIIGRIKCNLWQRLKSIDGVQSHLKFLKIIGGSELYEYNYQPYSHKGYSIQIVC